MTATGAPLSIAATFVLATALAMDAFAVSLSSGLATRKERVSRIARMPLAFGSFQAGMMVAGWSAVKGVQEVIASIDHWVAFGLLLGVGGHMIVGGVRGKEREARDLLDFKIIFVLAVATSIDAFAVGMSLSLVRHPLLWPAAITGVVTFALSAVAVYIGNRAGPLLGRSAEVAGGFMLVAIGVRILLDHTG